MGASRGDDGGFDLFRYCFRMRAGRASALRTVPPLPGSEPMMPRVESAALRVVPTGGPLGADIEGVDLAREIDEGVFTAILAAWAQRLVLRFRGQQLDENRLMAFSSRFGSLDRAPVNTAATRLHANPFVLVVSNIVEDGRPIGSLGAYESQWHADMSYNPEPPLGSLLYAVEVPPSGGDTSFLK